MKMKRGSAKGFAMTFQPKPYHHATAKAAAIFNSDDIANAKMSTCDLVRMVLTLRLSDAGLRRRQTKLIYSDHRSPPCLTEYATPCDRSNRLLGLGGNLPADNRYRMRHQLNNVIHCDEDDVPQTFDVKHIVKPFHPTRVVK
jgi:hypothetical protein